MKTATKEMSPVPEPSVKVFKGCTHPDSRDDVIRCTVWTQEFTINAKIPESHGQIIGDADHAARNIQAQEDVVAAEDWLEQIRNKGEYAMLVTGTGESDMRRYTGRL